ncbi:hypothetical protein E8E13_009414 [Curvularia kusanoi]|uniref:Clr5 domain-containing protein n=1 Tax=Curvularia kusanoi TaxID=90978 RepID=A0A9P4WC18_CURKU|nr:hypothetical protein E8E13_009414 [Curvularia kusanoi]
MERFDPSGGSMADVQLTVINSEKKACKPRARRLTERDWAEHKDEIVGLYSVQGLALPKVQAIFKARHNFAATDRQWKHRFKQWELDKNVKSHEMKAMVRILQDRKVNQPDHPNINFKIRGISVDHRKIERWMHEHNIADDKLYNPGATASTPPELEYHTRQDHSSPLPNAATGPDNRASSPISTPLAVVNTEADIAEMEDEPMLSKPRCKVVDLSWALNVSIQELRDEATWFGFIRRWEYFSPRKQVVSFEDDLERCKELTSLALEYGAQVNEPSSVFK